MIENIYLERFIHGSTDLRHSLFGTVGQLTLPSGQTLYTAEQPWNGNRQFLSCVPVGVYPLVMEYSPKVEKITRGKYSNAWTMKNVPNRTQCRVHPANWPSELQGCIAPGMKYGVLSGRLAVLNSNDAFDIFMAALVQETYYLHIIDRVTSYP